MNRRDLLKGTGAVVAASVLPAATPFVPQKWVLVAEFLDDSGFPTGLKKDVVFYTLPNGKIAAQWADVRSE